MQQYVEPTGTAGWQRKANKKEDLSSEVFGFCFLILLLLFSFAMLALALSQTETEVDASSGT